MKNSVISRAGVIGGSIAGLFAARVLSDVYDEVVIVDRDTLVGVNEPRRNRPQGRHINAMHCRGRLTMEELFPGITEQMISSGCPSGDMAGNVRWYFKGKRAKPQFVDLLAVPATAPVMEWHIRERTQALPNVTFLEQHDVTGLETTADGSRVTGMRVGSIAEGGAETVIDTDLVIDAAGRASRTPAWLEQLGYPRVEEERTKISLGYVTQHYRMDKDPWDGDLAIIPVASPKTPRGAIFTKTDSGKFELTAYGLLGDYPPTDQAGFYSFIRSLQVPEISEALEYAVPIDEPVAFRFPATIRRRFEKMAGFPDGLLVTGDAVTCFNPVYAQGMTVAAVSALVLRDHLNGGSAPKPLQFFHALAHDVIDPPWEMTQTVDLSFPSVPGPRTAKVRMGQTYLGMVQTAATHDGNVTAAYMRAAGMVDPPTALMRPSMVMRVMWDCTRQRLGDRLALLRHRPGQHGDSQAPVQPPIT
jgi:2-polyprenyl-6-methoxyphenol hydroxylase-like FAD-dependent oxidoreductase